MFQDFFLRLKLDNDFRKKVFTFIGVIIALIGAFIALVFITISNAQQNQNPQTENNPKEDLEAQEEFKNSFSNSKNFQKLSEKPLSLPTIGTLNNNVELTFYSYQNTEEGFIDESLTFSTGESVDLSESFIPTSVFQTDKNEVILNGINQALLIKNKKNVLNYPKDVLGVTPEQNTKDYLFLKNENGVLYLQSFSSILGNGEPKKEIYSEFLAENTNYSVHSTSISPVIIKSETINKSGDIEVTSLSSLLKVRKTLLEDVSFYFINNDFLFYQEDSDIQNKNIRILNLLNMKEEEVNFSSVFEENELKGSLELFRCTANLETVYCLTEKEAVDYLDYSEDSIISFDLSKKEASLIYEDYKINGYSLFTNENNDLVVISQPSREAYLILE